MKSLITNKEGVILSIGDVLSQSETESNVLMLDGCGFGIFGQIGYEKIEVPSNVVAQLYTYDGVNFAPYKSEQDKIKQEAIDIYTMELIEKGVL